MRRFLLPLFLLAVISVPALNAQNGGRDIGPIEIQSQGTTQSIRVSGSPELVDQLANLAFEAHGGYRRLASGASLDARFTALGSNQVQVDLARGGSRILSQTVAGNSMQHATLKAADLVVEATSRSRGFFASQLAFISERTGSTEVYTGNLFFSDVRQITSDRALAMLPRWSPDGSKLIYTSFHRSNAADILMIDMRSMQRLSFVSFKGTNQGGRFSPDGNAVAMVLSGEGNPEIYLANAQGRGIARRTRTNGVEASPVFSPDGRQLLFSSDQQGGPQLYVMSTGGGSMRRLATNISGYCAEPDWSVGDPNKIAFTTRIGRGYQIALYDLSKRADAVQVSNAPYDAVEPAWLADGRHLLYTARSPGQRSIWILDTETRRTTRLSPASLGMVSQAGVLAP